MDVVIIAWDGRALGVPPYGHYNQAYTLRAGQHLHMSTARRFDCLIRADKPINSYAEVKFLDTRGMIPGVRWEVVSTALIPIQIS